ncbi:FCS-Like Zinc finger 15 [Mercurialis annua]|uniref:FCS-Like Zinc finger 15 n=1 Tax=Mercurialis annua TaxID=3986 RepID=UPI00215F1CC4|nr:FCS-Like Zinc finger 15 [Mercurialis annua]
MVGLSIVLDNYNYKNKNKTPQVINKATMNLMMINKLPSSSSSNFKFPTFLEQCFLCGQKLMPCKDIYMYKGDRGFCSVECRCRQIFMDEEEVLEKENCSFAAMKPSTSASPPPPSSTSASRHRKSGKNRPGGFAY